MNKEWKDYEKDLVDCAYEEAYYAWLEERDMILEQLHQAVMMSRDEEVQKRILNGIKFIERCKQ